jgi:hypothetical protein
MGIQAVRSLTRRSSTDKTSHDGLVYNGGVQDHNCDVFSDNLLCCDNSTSAVLEIIQNGLFVPNYSVQVQVCVLSIFNLLRSAF